MNHDSRDERIDERIAELEAENARLREQVELLAAQLQDVQARLAKDSRNSGKPPSSDGLGRTPHKTTSLRTKSGKKAGGQLGHRGETLRLVATPDEVVEHRPATCTQCHSPLQTAPVVLRERCCVSGAA
jgi:transposase